VYQLWVFVHFLGVFGFLISHGISIVVAFQLRGERDPGRISHLLELSGSSTRFFYPSLLVLVTGGTVAGFLGDWWSQGWIWASIAVLVLTSVAMFAMASPYYRRVRLVARAMAGGSQAVSDEQLDQILRARRPITVAAVGFGGLLLILYMMIFKPTLGLAPGETTGAAEADVAVVAEGNAFDSNALDAPAERAFSIAFENRDAGIPHNVAIYRDESASDALFVGELFPGRATRTYRVPALDAGTYYFRCDVHPQMDGTFEVT
jgi:plastocyanin